MLSSDCSTSVESVINIDLLVVVVVVVDEMPQTPEDDLRMTL